MKITYAAIITAIATAADAKAILTVYSGGHYTGLQRHYYNPGTYVMPFIPKSWEYDGRVDGRCCIHFFDGPEQVGKSCVDKKDPTADWRFNRVYITC